MGDSRTSRNLDEAADWVARLEVATWAEADEQELQLWLSGDPRRHGALLQMQALWRMREPSSGLTVDQSPPQSSQDHVVIQPTSSRRWSSSLIGRRGLLAGGGATIAASLAGGILLLRQGRRLNTELGEIRRIPLDDGSIAALNTASQVEIAFAAKRRDVRLDQGEAWFQVAKDPSRPFLVEAGPFRVRAVGTAFAVRRHAAGIEVFVTEGIVEAWSESSNEKPSRLSEGHRAYLSDSQPPEIVTDAPIGAALAWRNGRVELTNERLIDAITEFNRYNRLKLILMDPELADKRLDGFFRTDDAEGFARSVGDTLHVPVNLIGEFQIAIGSKKNSA